jgi:hypothetical protein
VPTGNAEVATDEMYGDGPSNSERTKDVAAPALLTGTRTESVIRLVNDALKK